MLIAPNIPEGDARNATTGDALEIQRSTPTGKNLHRIASFPNQEYRPIGYEYFVFIDTGSDEHLILFAGFSQCCTRARVRGWILWIDNQRSSTEWIRWGLLNRLHYLAHLLSKLCSCAIPENP